MRRTVAALRCRAAVCEARGSGPKFCGSASSAALEAAAVGHAAPLAGSPDGGSAGTGLLIASAALRLTFPSPFRGLHVPPVHVPDCLLFISVPRRGRCCTPRGQGAGAPGIVGSADAPSRSANELGKATHCVRWGADACVLVFCGAAAAPRWASVAQAERGVHARRVSRAAKPPACLCMLPRARCSVLASYPGTRLRCCLFRAIVCDFLLWHIHRCWSGVERL